jgi:hypothetical protein
VADEPLALLNMHRHARPPAVAELQPDAPPDLAALAEAALRKDPAQRPADGNALLAALDGEAPTMLIAPADTAVTRVVPAPVSPAGGPPPRRLWREPAVIAAAVVLLALGGGLLAWAVTRSDAPAPAGPTTAAHPTHTHTTTPTTQPAPPTTSTTTPGTTTRTAPTTTSPATTIAPPTTVTIPTTTPTTTLTTPETTTSGAGTTTATP